MSAIIILMTVTSTLTVPTLMEVSHVHVKRDTQEMEHSASVRDFLE